MEEHESGASLPLARRMERFVARFADRVPDWHAFEESSIPGYHRAQHRYVGAGASGKHDDPQTIPPGNFTVSVMLVPPGEGTPPHTHEVEEVFFLLRGALTCFWCEGDERAEQVLGPWDLAFNPPGMIHGYHNHTDEDAYLEIMLGRARPELPAYLDEQHERVKYGHLGPTA